METDPRTEAKAGSVSCAVAPDGSEAATSAVQHLTSLAEGWECAAKLEDAIVAAHQPELDAFSASKAGDGDLHDLRLIRAVLDARSNRDGYLKDARAVRTVLAVIANTQAKAAGTTDFMVGNATARAESGQAQRSDQSPSPKPSHHMDKT